MGSEMCIRDRFGSSEDYARIYFERFSEGASYFAASASACGLVFEQAINECDKGELIDNIQSLDFDSFYGRISFDDQGKNVGKKRMAIQLSFHDGELIENVVWPREFSNSHLVWPIWRTP